MEETSFQRMVDSEYIGVGGMFGITPGATPPRWTLAQLAHELMGEYVTMPLNKRAIWADDATVILGIIQQTVNKYAAILGDISKKKYENTTAEWDLWQEENQAA